jgi:hypothetical protein
MKIPKYKICKIENGNGRVYYIIKEKKYFWWTTVQVYRSAYSDDSQLHFLSTVSRGYYDILEFDTFSQACEWVDAIKSIKTIKHNNNIKKVLECTER